jgi:hypothetical protein
LAISVYERNLDEKAFIRILKKHLDPSVTISFDGHYKDVKILIIKSQGIEYTLIVGEYGIDNEMTLSVKKGPRPTLGHPLLEPLRAGILEYMRYEAPLDEEDQEVEPSAANIMPLWISRMPTIVYELREATRSGKVFQIKEKRSVIRNRKGAYFIHRFIEYDDFIFQDYLDLDTMFEYQSWNWLFIPVKMLLTQSIVLENEEYPRQGDEHIATPVGILDCALFQKSLEKSCSCTKRVGTEGKGSRTCPECSGQLRLKMELKYWFDKGTGILVKSEETHSLANDKVVLLKSVEPADILKHEEK